MVKMLQVLLCCGYWLSATESVFAFSGESVLPEVIKTFTLDEKECRLHVKAERLIQSFSREKVNQLGTKYSFQRTMIDHYVIIPCGLYTWELCNETGETICEFLIKVTENEHDAAYYAFYIKKYGNAIENDRQRLDVRRIGSAYYICATRQEKTSGTTCVIKECIDTYIEQGVIITQIKWSDSRPLNNLYEQARLLSHLVASVRNKAPQKEALAFIEHALNQRRKRERKKEEEFQLRTTPGYRMQEDIGDMERDEQIFKKLPVGGKQFIHPGTMWCRPSLQWFSQFQSNIYDRRRGQWNERGDRLTLTIPATKKQPVFQCRVYVAHTISEYDALRFMTGFALDRFYERTPKREDSEQMHRVNPRLVGEYDLALKPQLDATGALIPNAEESDICFVRNNTAVRVVADRPDVSVLWIARKIDEELIAAGKGEPPTWTPRKVPAPVPAAGSK